MTQEHPITPPPELFKQWEDDILNERDNVDHVLDCAWRNGFQAGADQELEACCHEVQKLYGVGRWLRSTRRVESLKEQALALLDDASDRLDAVHENTIRRALESLPD